MLLNQAIEIQNGTSLPTKWPPLKLEHERFLEEHMSTLLSASVGAFTLHHKRHGIKVNEAESRHDWDALLYRFYTVDGEGSSPYIL